VLGKLQKLVGRDVCGRRRQQTSSADVPGQDVFWVHGSTSSRRRCQTSSGPVHDVFTTSNFLAGNLSITCNFVYLFLHLFISIVVSDSSS